MAISVSLNFSRSQFIVSRLIAPPPSPSKEMFPVRGWMHQRSIGIWELTSGEHHIETSPNRTGLHTFQTGMVVKLQYPLFHILWPKSLWNVWKHRILHGVIWEFVYASFRSELYLISQWPLHPWSWLNTSM